MRELKNCERTIDKQLSLAMHLKQKHFIYVEMGESDPEELGIVVKAALKSFKGIFFVAISTDNVETHDIQWKKWQKFLQAADFHPRISVNKPKKL